MVGGSCMVAVVASSVGRQQGLWRSPGHLVTRRGMVEFDEPSLAPKLAAGGHPDAIVAVPADSDDVSP